jgi:hypothetical protein
MAEILAASINRCEAVHVEETSGFSRHRHTARTQTVIDMDKDPDTDTDTPMDLAMDSCQYQ